MFIMLDGIDGSGKSTIIKTFAEYFLEKNLKVFDLVKFWKEQKDYPKAADLMEYDVIISAEPTHIWFGSAIRHEITKKENDYSAETIANAFAMDRLVLYKRILLPLLKAQKTIIQDRGISTSLCYQPLQDGIDINYVANLEGNKFALKNTPNYLIIADLPVEIALGRLGDRYGKQDNSIFENKEFLNNARAKFLDPDYQKYFKEQGAKIEVLNTATDIDIMKKEAIALLGRIAKI